MIELTHKPTVREFLSLKENEGFWTEIGFSVDLPDGFRFLYESGNMMILEPFLGRFAVHIACLDRGKNAVLFAKNCFHFIRSRMNVPHIYTAIQLSRKEVIFFAKACGMVRYRTDSNYAYMMVPICH